MRWKRQEVERSSGVDSIVHCEKDTEVVARQCFGHDHEIVFQLVFEVRSSFSLL